MSADDLTREVARRRTFAIISHPDAGKTTLTEKLLLYAGAVDLAGAVRHRQQQRHAVSDWMTMERERGISITSTVLQFDHAGLRFNLLDTPGHQDFGEDTYRTLLAADSAVMILDAAKGIEPQTAKLFAACRRRRLPVITFINKMDREGRDPLALLDAIASELGLSATALNWPIGGGDAFRGVYDLPGRRVLRFARTFRNQHRAPMLASALDDPATVAALGAPTCRQLREEIALLVAAGNAFERDAFLRGDLTPVFFGSALTNLAVEPLLAALCTLAPSPAPRTGTHGAIRPDGEGFSGFIYKIQANMDPRHHDRMAFLRVCSGHFRRGMLVHHGRLGRQIRVARPHRLFAQGRELLEEAFAGDVIGLSNPGLFAIGDTLSEDPTLAFPAFPRFPPERFALLRNGDIGKQKQFRRGLAQLEDEGVVQVWSPVEHRGEPILAAVGALQFDVVAARLASEYGVNAAVEPLPHLAARRVESRVAGTPSLHLPSGEVIRVLDREGRLVLVFASTWALRHAERENPTVALVALG